MEHWFWIVFCLTVIAWYVAVTIVVGIKGGKDIKEMISVLKEKRDRMKEQT